jgi:hypothetical protein
MNKYNAEYLLYNNLKEIDINYQSDEVKKSISDCRQSIITMYINPVIFENCISFLMKYNFKFNNGVLSVFLIKNHD